MIVVLLFLVDVSKCNCVAFFQFVMLGRSCLNHRISLAFCSDVASDLACGIKVCFGSGIVMLSSH